MEDEKLIECVRRFQFLYNLQHPKYMDSQKKEMAWKWISEEVKHPAAACKQRWQALRDAYRRALNKKKRKYGQGAKNLKKWKYDDEMSFLTEFLTEKTLDSTRLTSEDEESTQQLFQPFIEMQDPVSDISMNSSVGELAASSDTGIHTTSHIEDESTINNRFSYSEHSQAKKFKNMKSEVQPQTASAVLMSRLLDQQNDLLSGNDHDELDRFFLNISDTVKKFSPYLQALAKNKVFNLVSEMELQQLSSTTFAIPE